MIPRPQPTTHTNQSLQIHCFWKQLLKLTSSLVCKEEKQPQKYLSLRNGIAHLTNKLSVIRPSQPSLASPKKVLRFHFSHVDYDLPHQTSPNVRVQGRLVFFRCLFLRCSLWLLSSTWAAGLVCRGRLTGPGLRPSCKGDFSTGK